MRYPFRGLTLALCALALVAGATDVSAQAWPQKPIRIINPFPPGGGTDVFARPLAAKLSVALGQQVIIENMAGRRRHRRRCARREGGAGRLHLVHGRGASHDRRNALHEAALQPRARLRAGDGRGVRAERRRHPSEARFQVAPGADRVREGEPEQAQLRLRGQRHDAPSVGRAVQDDDRHAAHARARTRVRGRSSPALLAGEVDLAFDGMGTLRAADQGRQAPPARRDDERRGRRWFPMSRRCRRPGSRATR